MVHQKSSLFKHFCGKLKKNKMELGGEQTEGNVQSGSPDLREALWFAAVTVSLNNLVFVLCGILELVERYDLFKDSRIQIKVG